MIKKIFTFLLILSMSIFIVSCDSNSGGGSTTDDTFKRVAREPDEFEEDTIAELPNDYVLVWADEFNYEGTLDSDRWNYEIGTGNYGWGNNEAQYYTSRLDNAVVSDGIFSIIAKKESYSGSNYTSARVTTKLKGDFKYGYIEMRAKLPSGGGTWPAFWLMPTYSVYGGWPTSGEIDIMEMVGNNPNVILGTTHSDVTQGGGAGGRTYCSTASTDYNTYAIRWTDEKIEFILNGTTYYTFSHLSSYTYRQWPFDQEFFLILNVAMGGNLGGNIDANFTESSMDVDYVRVYKQIDKTDTEAPSKVELTTVSSSSNTINLAWEKASDNQGIKHYEIVVNNKTIGATFKNNYTITGLSPDTNYQVRVISVDYNDNWTLSDITSVKTNGVSTIPGIVEGISYSTSSGDVSHQSGNDSGYTEMMAMRNGSSLTYDVNAESAGNYNFKLRLATRVNCTLKIEVYSSSELVYQEELSLGRTYGSYIDTELANSVQLPKGSFTIVLSCTSSASTDSVLLNYIDIEKE